MFNSFFAAISFLTVIPFKRNFTLQTLVKSIMFFPLVGLLIGGILAGLAYMFVSVFFLPYPSLVAVILLFWVALTGGLHLDGLADSLDGIAGGDCPEKRLLIMKDSRVGTYGVIGIVILLLLKYGFLLGMMGKEVLVITLLLAPLYSRWAIILFMFKAPTARDKNSLGYFFSHEISLFLVIITTIFTIAFSIVILKSFLMLAVIIIFLLAAVLSLRIFFSRSLGGITGDTIGATNEICEVIVLFIFLV